MISSGATGYDRKLWEHTDYWYDAQAWLPRNIVFVNKAAFDKLSAAEKKAVTDAAKVAEEYLRPAPVVTILERMALNLTVIYQHSALERELRLARRFVTMLTGEVV